MNNEGRVIFAVIISFIIICSPTITFAQWPITADPSVVQNGLQDDSRKIGNQTQQTSNNTAHSKNQP
ncbi:MAG TPA: hypothetical protein VJS91_09605 [Nitrososphaeraceae archaeon]|nr:hypothetical protein [Nitrososphaeraceae archaeon]